MTKKVDKNRLSFLSEVQLSQLKQHFTEPQTTAMPHQIAVMLGITYSQALCVLAVLESSGVTDNFLLVYHNCSEAPVGTISYGLGFPQMPWRCPNCENKVESLGELSFDVLAKSNDFFEIS